MQRYFRLVIAVLVAGCGRLGFDPLPLEDRADAAAMSVELPLEDAVFPDGWSADVWVDFSADYTYIDVQYLDVTYPMNNRPHHMVLLPAPFEPGIALVGTWEIWEVHAPDVFVSHFYYPGKDDGPGPDAFFDAVFCEDWMGAAPGLCVAAGSQNGGDGVYLIGADWSIERISSTNNVGDIMFDPTGAFDDIGMPTLYWSGPDGLRRFGEGIFYPGMLNGGFTEILPSDEILTMHTDENTGLRRLVLLESISHDETVVLSTASPDASEWVARQHAGVYATVAGDPGRFGGRAYAIVATRDLVEIDADGAATVIAQAGPGWRWVHALIPPSSHPLGADTPAMYVLEFNPDLEINRIIRVRPPG